MHAMISSDGKETPLFRSIIDDTVKMWIENSVGGTSEFAVMGVQEKDGRQSYWGVLDCTRIPEEDLYTEMFRRFYCAYRTIGEDNIIGIGVFDIRAVMNRTVPSALA